MSSTSYPHGEKEKRSQKEEKANKKVAGGGSTCFILWKLQIEVL
ncbi:hypothetical protein ACA086_03300 [Muriicola sp. E247]